MSLQGYLIFTVSRCIEAMCGRLTDWLTYCRADPLTNTHTLDVHFHTKSSTTHYSSAHKVVSHRQYVLKSVLTASTAFHCTLHNLAK